MGFVVGGNLLESVAHVGAAVHEFHKGLAVEGVHGALQALKVHLIAGLGVQIEHVFMAAFHRHLHGKGHGGEAALNVAHPEIDAEGVDAAVAVFAAARGAGAHGADQRSVVEADLVLARVHGLEQMRILFLIDGFHGNFLYGRHSSVLQERQKELCPRAVPRLSGRAGRRGRFL